ncbi:MAG TPA: hypothetical protein VEF04_15710, partial [Blastocatellia bacterium]|nr:hypothetical protein [Blastocatellia bacterium]
TLSKKYCRTDRKFKVGDKVTNNAPFCRPWLHGVVIAVGDGNNEEYHVQVDATRFIYSWGWEFIVGHRRRSARLIEMATAQRQKLAPT